jgi:hypothetical protein
MCACVQAGHRPVSNTADLGVSEQLTVDSPAELLAEATFCLQGCTLD